MQKILWSKTSLVQKFLVWSNFHVQLIRINAKKYCCQKWALDQKNIVDHKFLVKKNRTNIAWANVAWANITGTVMTCYRWSQKPRFKIQIMLIILVFNEFGQILPGQMLRGQIKLGWGCWGELDFWQLRKAAEICVYEENSTGAADALKIPKQESSQKWLWAFFVSKINFHCIFHIFTVKCLKSLQRWIITEWLWSFLERRYQNISIKRKSTPVLG